MKELKTNLKFVYKYARDEKKRFVLFVILNAITVAISILSPILSAKIIVALTTEEFKQVIYIALAMLLFSFILDLINLLIQRVSFKMHRNALAKAELDLGGEILKLSNAAMEKHGTGVFIQRLNNDISKITDVFGFMLNMLSSIVRDVGIFVAVFIINKEIFVYLMLVSTISFCIEKMRASKRNEQDKLMRKQREKVSGFASEMVRGQKDIKLLNSEKNFTGELKGRIDEAFNLNYNMVAVGSKYRFYSGVFDDISSYVRIALLVFLIIQGKIDGPTALILYNYSSSFRGFAFVLGNILERLKDFNLSCNRVREVFEGENFETEKFGKNKIKDVKGNFEFNNVEFYYEENKPVLKDLNFKIKANETVAFVGKSGSGKSTIFSLICKLYDPVKGTIKLDGVDLNTLDRDTIRGNITVISQSPYIFNMSIRDNLKIVKENLKEEDMIKYSKMACFDEFVQTLPNGYDTMIGEGGINLSGGEKQRLAITRALIQESKVVLFDEATSALDNLTQSKIQEAIDNMKDKYTILIIAHRLSTIINADKIMFLEDGKIKEQGTHKELLKSSESYKNLYEKELKSNK